MASPTTPTHGKLAALYVLRPNGFSGSGLNDFTWGTGATNAATAFYEVLIDGELSGGGGADTFKWRKNGGGWTATVDITGAAQTLDETQTLTFAATTGHTADDQWTIGNFTSEGTSESTNTAQITTVANRRINPNSPPTWTDDGGETVLTTNFTNGTAVFTDTVGTVTVGGNNGFIRDAALQKVAYCVDWTYDLTLDMADMSRMGQQWKDSLPGQAGGSGSMGGYFIGTETLYSCLSESIGAGDKYFLVEFFNVDTDQDQTGDHTIAWVTFDGFSPQVDIGSVVQEQVSFVIQGQISFTANA